MRTKGPVSAVSSGKQGVVLLGLTIFLVHFRDLGGIFSETNDIVIELGQVGRCRQLGAGDRAQGV